MDMIIAKNREHNIYCSSSPFQSQLRKIYYDLNTLEKVGYLLRPYQYNTIAAAHIEKPNQYNSLGHRHDKAASVSDRNIITASEYFCCLRFLIWEDSLRGQMFRKKLLPGRPSWLFPLLPRLFYFGLELSSDFTMRPTAISGLHWGHLTSMMMAKEGSWGQ